MDRILSPLLSSSTNLSTWKEDDNDNKAEIVILKQIMSCDSDETKSTVAGSIFSALSSVIQFHDIESSPSSSTMNTGLWSIATSVKSRRSYQSRQSRISRHSRHSRNTNSSIKHISIRGPRSILRSSTFASSKITYADFSYDEYASDDDTMITQETGISAPRYQPSLRQQQSQDQDSYTSTIQNTVDQFCNFPPGCMIDTDSTFSTDTEDTPVYEMVVSKDGSEVCKCECSEETIEQSKIVKTKGTLNFGDGESEEDLVNFEYIVDVAGNIEIDERNLHKNKSEGKAETKKKNTLIAWKEDVEIVHFESIQNSETKECRKTDYQRNESEESKLCPDTLEEDVDGDVLSSRDDSDESVEETEEDLITFLKRNPDLVIPFTLVPLLCIIIG